MKPPASTSIATSALGSRPRRLSWSTTVRPRHGPWVTSISTCRRSSGQQVGIDHVGDGEGIVHWGVVMPIDLEVEPPVEGVQVGDHGAGVTRLTQRLGAGGAEHRAVGDVEADHRDVEAGREDAVGGLGVAPDVELGARGDVADARRRRPSARSARSARAARGGWRAAGRCWSAGRSGSASAGARAACAPSARRRGSARGSRDGGGRSGPSSPVSPWTSSAARAGWSSARSAPAATGMSARRRRRAPSDRVRRHLLQASRCPPPWSRPRRSSSGLARASRRAMASSWPGSQSMITGVGMAHHLSGPRVQTLPCTSPPSFSAPSSRSGRTRSRPPAPRSP